jgi:hypothetical protein
MTDFKKLFKAAWERADGPACCDVIDLGLRESGDDFVGWLAKDAAAAVIGLGISRAEDGCEPPYLDSFALTVGLCLQQCFRDREELPRHAWAWLIRSGSPSDWEQEIANCARTPTPHTFP